MNPDFSDFVHIFVPYCSGDVWIGQAPNAINPFGKTNGTAVEWQGYFQGHMILEKVLDTVVRKSMVEEVLLTGCSAGGMGTFCN